MGKVPSFTAASTQEQLTLIDDDISENEFGLSPKPQERSLKTTGLCEGDLDEMLKDTSNL